MNNIKVSHKPQFLPILVTKSTTSNNSNGKNANKDNYCGQTFKDIFKQKLESEVSSRQDTAQRTFPVLFNKRLVY